jgi:hypothetical protein
MRPSQITFIAIAGLYFLVGVIRLFVSDEAYSVVPGWHITLDYRGSFERGLAVLYFLAISLIYGLINRINRTLFILHVLISILPIGISFGIQLIDMQSTSLVQYYEKSQRLEICFLLLHTIFLIILYNNYWQEHKRITQAPQNTGSRI